MTADRETWTVPTPAGGWDQTWRLVSEVLSVSPHTDWTMIGGLMVQVHAAHAGLPLIRPTNDVDMLLHIETGATTFSRTRFAVESIGFALQLPSLGDSVHRFARADPSTGARDQIDVMVADHAAPRVLPPPVRGFPVFAVPGGTAALRRTVNCVVDVDGRAQTISVPDSLAALVLKGAAYIADHRDGDRHLTDAAVLAAAIRNPRRERSRMRGSDGRRIAALAGALSDSRHIAWRALDPTVARHGHDVIEILARPVEPGPVSPF
ncbi:hypothetical protein [Gordonia sp. FQ]|uniref:hypothetical protein n=1 Tax=Gordonia sp. FQ TaxID=3446634 RepID=UPI003F83CE6D